jgi:isopropylmalate/homocitrate/citramalate synthase
LNGLICEVGPRDGLQNESETLPPPMRAELIDRLGSTGLTRIETVSFVRPDTVPQMADAETVLELASRRPEIVYSGLVLNARGLERFLASPLDEAHLVIAVSDTFSERNSNSTVAEALAFSVDALAELERAGRSTTVAIAVAFGCPFEGRIDPGRVSDLAERLAAAGAQELSLADTIGVAAPREVKSLVARLARLGIRVGAHLHNTRNSGYANAVAALEAGASTLDSSIGGIGGCPYAPQASGNIATEDLVYILERDGVDTGIDLDALTATARWLEARLQRPLPGLVHRLETAAAD